MYRDVDDEATVVATLVGRTIVAAEWEQQDPGPGGGMGESGTLLTLDDGRRLFFGGWGHDNWGGTIELPDAP